MDSENPNAAREQDDKPVHAKHTAGDKNPKTDRGLPVSPQSAPAEDTNDGTCHCSKNPPKWWRILEGLALLSAIGYAIVTGFMWHDSHRNFMVDERAWIRIDALFPASVKEGDKVEVSVRILNFGKSPAKRVISENIISMLRITDEVKFNYPSPYITDRNAIMYPGDFFTGTARQRVSEFQPALFTKAEVDELINGRAYLAVYARGTYLDIFGETHWFHYCAWQSYYSGGTVNTFTCTAYNDAGDGKPPQ